MLVRIVILAVYLVVSLCLGFWVRRRSRSTAYFLAGRRLSPFLLTGTMVATNLSAFTIFGTSGIGYRQGLAFFPVMGFGTGFMALTFILIGGKIWELGKRYGLVTPAEMIHRLYNNRFLSVLFSLVLICFTLPYLALQPYAAGKVLHQLFGLSPAIGAGITTLIIILYTLRGGLKAIVLTDIFQGGLMLILLLLCLGLVASHFGGLGQAFGELARIEPELLSRQGVGGVYTPLLLGGYIFLWFFCDPMFPQIFQRFYAASSPRALQVCSVSYPVLCSIIFIIPISLGALGNLIFPGLDTGMSDSIMPLLLEHIGGDLFGTLVLTAGLAALMSTMDSQLLTLSSIFSRDLLPLCGLKRIGRWRWVNRGLVVGLAGVGLFIAVTCDTTILRLGLSAFTGLSVLFPCVIFGLYLQERAKALSGVFSILAGLGLVLLYHFKLLDFGSEFSAIPVMVVSTLVYLATQLWLVPELKVGRKGVLVIFGIGALLLLALAPFKVAYATGIHLWFPDWVWYFVGLSLVQSVGCLIYMLKVVKSRQAEV